MSLGVYAKAIVTAVVVGAGTLYTALDNDVITNVEWVAAALATLGASGGVWAVSPWAVAKYGKAIVAGLLGAGAVIVTGLVDGPLTNQEVLKAVIDGVIALGLIGAVVPNAAVSDPYRRNVP